MPETNPRAVKSPFDVALETSKAVEVLRRFPGVRRIWLFGSAARGSRLDWRSDLDLAVEGLDRADLESAWALLYENLRVNVDLIHLETARPLLRNSILQTGKLLYEC
jgi:predicted nucleotidyltransferase